MEVERGVERGVVWIRTRAQRATKESAAVSLT